MLAAYDLRFGRGQTFGKRCRHFTRAWRFINIGRFNLVGGNPDLRQ
jgi:hypothetical protein